MAWVSDFRVARRLETARLKSKFKPHGHLCARANDLSFLLAASDPCDSSTARRRSPAPSFNRWLGAPTGACPFAIIQRRISDWLAVLARHRPARPDPPRNRIPSRIDPASALISRPELLELDAALRLAPSDRARRTNIGRALCIGLSRLRCERKQVAGSSPSADDSSPLFVYQR